MNIPVDEYKDRLLYGKNMYSGERLMLISGHMSLQWHVTKNANYTEN